MRQLLNVLVIVQYLVVEASTKVMWCDKEMVCTL